MLAIAAICLVLNGKHLGEPPAYIHGWAQADNYSLALGFLHNGLDPLHPQTLIYNKQQFDFITEPSLVTACDLPLHHYLVALVMAVTGCRKAWVFRGMTLAVVIVGLWAFYLMAWLLTRSRARSLLAAAVVATSPAFAYYAGGFLPTAPSLALAMCAGLAYTLHVQRRSSSALAASVLLLTLATMQRTSLAVLWVAVAAFQLLRVIRREATLKSSWLPFAAGALVFAVWQVWSAHLRATHGSMFLGSLLPARSAGEAMDIFRYVHQRWWFQYFGRLQHWLFALLAVALAVTAAMRRVRRVGQGTSPWWLLAVLAVGEAMFAVAMMRQYHDHDYYFLDSLFVPLALLLVLMLAALPRAERRSARMAQWVAVAVMAVFMASGAMRSQQWRRTEGLDALQTAIRYKQANAMLAGLGVDGDARLMTLFSYPQNLPFCMMDREGYAVMWNDSSVVAHALGFDFDYIIVEDEIYRREFDSAQYILPRLRRLGGDGELSLCEVGDSALHATADSFFAQ